MRSLAGLRVVDWADEKGELCGRLLADFGAEVIRIEDSTGASSRHFPPFAPDGETSLYFGFRNAGKRGATFDLDQEAQREKFHALLAEADVLIESLRSDQLERWGLSSDELRRRHPHLVVTSISDFGRVGPYSDYQGSELVAFAMGGMMHRAGRFEKPPLVAPGAIAYDAAGIHAAFGTLLALWKRTQTGVGQSLDVSAIEAAANLSDWSLPNYSINPTVGPRAGAGIYTLYRCRDGYIRMIILVKHHWHALLDWVGHPEELEDPKYDQFVNRLMELPKIVAVLERFFEDKDKIEIAREAQARGIPATPLLRPAQAMSHEHAEARGTFHEIDLGGGHRGQAPSGFFTVDGERVGPREGPPAPGQTADVQFTEGPERDSFAALFASPKGTQEDGHPLRGVRVVDCGVGAVGVEVGRLLAEYGADVIKIETRRSPDFIRIIMSTWMNPSFASSSRSKRSFGVDMKQPAGVDLVGALVDRADVFIENNATGVTARLGFGAEALHARNPRIVSFSSQMVGSSGPWKDWVGYGPNTHPVSGLQYLWNYPEDEDSPAGSTNVYPDHLVGRLGAFAVVAGLLGRARSGQGSHTDAAQFEAAVNMLGDLMAKESLAPGSVRPLGNASERGAPWGCYRCEGEDEWCVISVRSDAEWLALRGAMGEPSWAQATELDTASGRHRQASEIDKHLEAWTQGRPPREAMEALQSAGVPCGVVAHPEHHLSDPQMAHRGYPKLVDQQGLTSMLLEGPGFLASDMPEVIVTQAPWLAEHTRDIAREELGLGDEEIDRLIAEGVLEDPPEGFEVE